MPWKFRKEPAKQASSNESGEIRASGRAPLSEVAKQVKRIEIVSGRNSAAQLSGQYKSRFRGQGVQFSDFRVYQFGDDVRHIDWRTSARSENTFIKTYEEERELNIVLVADVSASTGFGSTGQSKYDSMCMTLATIAFSAALNNDRVGLVLFSDHIERYVAPRKGRKHVLRIIDELLTHKTEGRRADLGPVLRHIEKAIAPNSTVVLASDLFLGLEKDKIKRAARRHDLVVARIADPRDAEFPKMGLVRLADPETGDMMIVDTSSPGLRKALGERHAEWVRRAEQVFRQSGASYLSLNTNSDVTKELMRFFRRRKGR